MSQISRIVSTFPVYRDLLRVYYCWPALYDSYVETGENMLRTLVKRASSGGRRLLSSHAASSPRHAQLRPRLNVSAAAAMATGVAGCSMFLHSSSASAECCQGCGSVLFLFVYTSHLRIHWRVPGTHHFARSPHKMCYPKLTLCFFVPF